MWEEFFTFAKHQNKQNANHKNTDDKENYHRYSAYPVYIRSDNLFCQTF